MEVALVDLYGPGGSNLQPLGALAEDEAAAARRPSDRQPDKGRWPSVGTVLRVLGLVIVAIVVLGWVVTALSA